MGILVDYFTRPSSPGFGRGWQNLPDANGHFGTYGGRFVAETLMPLLLELEAAYLEVRQQPEFWAELEELLQHYVGRPSPLYHAKRFTAELGGAQVWFKRDELNHTGAHKINHCLGQILLAKRMGKTRIIAETGAGQHGVATATVAALFGLPCTVYMGAEDVRRQSPNVFRMRLLGAEVVPVTSGTMTLKDATNEALRDWVGHVEDTFYILGSVVGPHPYPMMVRDFQTIIGLETRQQFEAATGHLPDAAVACVGGGSNAIGLFYGFLQDAAVKLIGVEAAGHGLERQHAATLSAGSPGVLHGAFSYLLQDAGGQIAEAHSISAGLDYPGVGPEHAYLKDQGRVSHMTATDKQALAAFQRCALTEGILAALEPSHALAAVCELAPTLSQDQHVVVNLCGRGDKDIFTIAEALKDSVTMPEIPTSSSKKVA